MTKIIYIIIVFGLLNITNAQEENKSASEPTSFPNAIIIGNYNPETGSGFKQFPSKTTPLTTTELDSLNDLEKQSFLLLPPEKIPNTFKIKTFPKGFLEGAFGRFTTPSLSAGYGFEAGKFDLFLDGNLEISNGHVENADYSTLRIGARSIYIAPEKFWLFGKSKTRSNLKFSNQNYKAYAQTDNPENLNALNIGIDLLTESDYEGLRFNTGLGFGILNFQSGDNTINDLYFRGNLHVENPFKRLNLGFKGELELHSIDGVGTSFLSFLADFRIESRAVKVNIKPGIATGSGTLNLTRSTPTLDLKFSYLINEDLTINALANSGLVNNSFISMFGNNPYLSDSAAIDLPHNILNSKLVLNYHGFTFIGFNFGLGYSLTNRDINLVNDDSFRFIPLYLQSNVFSIDMESYWDINSIHRLSSLIKFNFSNQDSTNKKITYLPDYELLLKYRANLSEDFGTDIGISYIGERFTDLENELALDPYLDVSFNVDYKLDNLIFFTKFENILNREIFIYNGFIQRGLFARLGVIYKF